MKFKTTAKEIRNNGGNVVKVGYCELQSLLQGVEPVAYTCGVYGWNFDVYILHGVTICTGYRGMVGRRANGASEYEKRAERIAHDYSINWEKRQELLDEIRRQFCEQA